MELKGAQLSFSYLQDNDIPIKVFVSDRHKGITKWVRECNPSTTHYFDQWHVAKSVGKKLFAASKKKGREIIGEWIPAVKNHIYWCSTSTTDGFEAMILAKWKSLLHHVSNDHTGHPSVLFPECAHDDDIEPRDWIKKGIIISLNTFNTCNVCGEKCNVLEFSLF